MSNKKGKYGRYLHRILAVGDFVILNAVFTALLFIYPGIGPLHSRLTILLLNVAYLPVSRWLTDTHRERALQMDRLIRTSIAAAGCHALAFTALLYVMGIDDIPWQPMAMFYGMFFPALTLWRIGTQFIIKNFRSRGRNYTRVVIIGCGPTGERLYREMTSDTGFGYQVQGFFDLYCPPAFPFKDLYRGNLADLDRWVRENDTEEIFYCISGENAEAIQLSIGLCDELMMKFHFVPQISPYMARNLKATFIGSMPVLDVLNNPLESPVNSAMKRAFDIVFSGAFLVVSPLIFIPVAIAIKLSSPGPVFFRQARTGYKGHEFLCWKFRTMRVNAQADSLQASKSDPRKTKVGDFLRRTSIDELPQFINVLRGDMSVVGPRPHMLKHTEDYSRLIKNYMVRHLIKPGITGWAQVRGFRGQTEELWQMQGRIEHDIWYIEHWSFLLDIKIIIRTMLNALKKDENAF